ncbi:MAG: extracellular solute-binding protein [Clostridium sp.]|nr:extracellular solute-binding protein [Clostridium sp.]
MKMKKVVSLFLTVAMVLSMAACGKKADEPKKDSGDKEGGKKTISILWPETDSTQVDVMENYIQPALKEKYPDIEFEYTSTTDNTNSPIKTMSASGDLPDIYFTGGGDMDAVLGAGDALDVAPYLEDGWLEENYTDPDMVKHGDAIYWLAAGQNAYYTPVFYYNTALFEANGVKEPTNMEELVAACKTFVDKGITPITTAGWVSSYSLVDGILASAAPDALEDLHARKCDWTDDRVKKALSYFDELKTMKAFSADIANKDDATAYSEFQAGNTAMMLTYSWFNGDMNEEKLGFVPGEFNFPAAQDDYIQLIFEPRKGNGCGYTANADTEDPELLTEILQLMVKAESERHNANGINTNFIVENPAEPANELEAERLEAYNAAKTHLSVLPQAQMDGVTIAEYTTLYNMLVSDDQGYLSENFIEEMQPVWEANTYGATD